jgi:hypothetical protein
MYRNRPTPDCSNRPPGYTFVWNGVSGGLGLPVGHLVASAWNT